MKASFDKNKIGPSKLKIASTMVQWLAGDIKHAAKRSIKSGGKSQKSRSYKTSSPGQPPFYHEKTFLNTIQVGEENRQGIRSYIIGATKDSRFETTGVKALEHGGVTMQNRIVSPKEEGLPKRKFYKTVQKLRGSKGHKVLKTVRAGKSVRERQSERGITTRHGKKTYQYKYFRSRRAWENARSSPRFLRWASAGQVITKRAIHVRARPFMRPAYAKIMTNDNLVKVWNKAEKFLS